MTNAEKVDDNILVFEPFIRTKFPTLICLFGHSGCGKTLSAIKIARGLGGKTLFLDTETGRGKVYAKYAEGFTYAELTPPFTPERYIAAIVQAEKAGFDNLVLDSGSHEWDGLGGMLEIADNRVDSKGRKVQGKAKWSVKSRHKSFTHTMMAGRMNVIICLRAKDRFVKKIIDNREVEIIDGFIPLQERNFKYDMMIQLPMPEGGKGRFLMDETIGFKCPEELLPLFKPDVQINEETGRAINAWISTGAPVDELLRQLREAARKEAEEGVDHFREYWKTLPKDRQLQLKPYLSNFESIAREADLANAEDDPEMGAIGPAEQAAIAAGITPRTALELNPMRMPRDPADSDWWTVIDELEIMLKAVRSPKEFVDFQADHGREIASFSFAPAGIRKYWNAIIDSARDRMLDVRAA